MAALWNGACCGESCHFSIETITLKLCLVFATHSIVNGVFALLKASYWNKKWNDLVIARLVLLRVTLHGRTTEEILRCQVRGVCLTSTWWRQTSVPKRKKLCLSGKGWGKNPKTLCLPIDCKAKRRHVRYSSTVPGSSLHLQNWFFLL